MTQVTEAGNSNNMEKMGFIKVLNKLKEKIDYNKQITTDQHKQVRKYLYVNTKKKLITNLIYGTFAKIFIKSS